jgi:hypothetical protein
MSDYSDDLAKLAALYPRTFFLAGRDRRPLKGRYRSRPRRRRHRDFVPAAAWRAEPVPPLGGYLEAMREGTARVDLAGEPAGIVTAADELHAISRMFALEAANAARWQEAREARKATRLQRCEARQQPKAKRQIHAEPKPAPASAPSKPLGLADLRTAWRERQTKQAVAP